MRTDLVESEWHPHLIVAWAIEEKCYFCGFPASHKVTEDYVGPYHPYTAYVCCNHFWAGCRNGAEPNGYANGHTFDRT